MGNFCIGTFRPKTSARSLNDKIGNDHHKAASSSSFDRIEGRIDELLSRIESSVSAYCPSLNIAFCFDVDVSNRLRMIDVEHVIVISSDSDGSKASPEEIEAFPSRIAAIEEESQRWACQRDKLSESLPFDRQGCSSERNTPKEAVLNSSTTTTRQSNPTLAGQDAKPCRIQKAGKKVRKEGNSKRSLQGSAQSRNIHSKFSYQPTLEELDECNPVLGEAIRRMQYQKQVGLGSASTRQQPQQNGNGLHCAKSKKASPQVSQDRIKPNWDAAARLWKEDGLFMKHVRDSSGSAAGSATRPAVAKPRRPAAKPRGQSGLSGSMSANTHRKPLPNKAPSVAETQDNVIREENASRRKLHTDSRRPRGNQTSKAEDHNADKKPVLDQQIGAVQNTHITGDRQQADEQEWSNRKRVIQQQQQEAQEERKRKRASNDLATRLNARLQEHRASQGAHEAALVQKDSLRAGIRARILRTHSVSKSKGLPHLLSSLGYRILPLGDRAAISRAYRQVMVKYHPDRHTLKPISEQIEAEEIFKLVSEAANAAGL